MHRSVPTRPTIPLLLDTHVLIWIGYGLPAVPNRVRARLANDLVYVSEITRCEIVINEHAKRRSFGIDFDRLIARAGFLSLALPVGVHRTLERLPPIHRDPFDRLLIAQALSADLTLVTSDEKITKYPVPTYW